MLWLSMGWVVGIGGGGRRLRGRCLVSRRFGSGGRVSVYEVLFCRVVLEVGEESSSLSRMRDGERKWRRNRFYRCWGRVLVNGWNVGYE
jgi:hypothetical protein